MSKNKKILFGLASVAALTTIAAVSCGGSKVNLLEQDAKIKKLENGKYDGTFTLANKSAVAFAKRFDQKEDGKVVIGVTFSRGKYQWNALSGIVKEFNEKFKDHKDYLPVSIEGQGSGYGAGNTKIVQGLSSKSIDFNITLNYNTVASTLANNGMLLNLADKDEDLGVELDYFSKLFADAINNAEGIANEGVWAIPAMKSTNAMGINQPVLAYIMKEMVAHGAKVDPAYKAEYDAILAAGAADEAYVAKLWGAYEADATTLLATKKITINKDTFTTLKPLLEFNNVAQKSFVNSKNPKTELHMLGIDDAAGFIETIAFATVGGDYTKYPIKAEIDGRGVKTINFNGIKDVSTEAGRGMEKIYNAIKSSVEARSIVFNGDGEYTSNYQTAHKYAFGLGSTAGYYHNWKPEGAKVTNAVVTVGENSTNISGNAVATGSVKNDALSIKVGKYSNKVVASTATAGKHDYQSTDTANDAVLNQIISGHTEQTAYIYLQSNNTKDINTVEKIPGVLKLSVKNGKYTNFLFVVPNSTGVFTVTQIGSEGALNESEFLAYPAPGKFESTDSKFVSFVQGPNMIGIHSTEKEDKATKLFIKYYTSAQKSDFPKEYSKGDDTHDGTPSKETVNETPSQHMARIASYIFPYKGFENDTLVSDNKSLVVAFKQYAEAVKDPSKFTIFEEPAAAGNSEKFRSALQVAYRALNDKATAGNELGNYKTEIVDSIVNSASDLFK